MLANGTMNLSLSLCFNSCFAMCNLSDASRRRAQEDTACPVVFMQWVTARCIRDCALQCSVRAGKCWCIFTHGEAINVVAL